MDPIRNKRIETAPAAQPQSKRRKGAATNLTDCVSSSTQGARLTLRSLPPELQKCLIPFLAFDAQAAFSQVCSTWREYVGNRAIYTKVLQNLRPLKATRRTQTISKLNAAGQIQARINNGCPEAMFHFANALTHTPVASLRTYNHITTLLQNSVTGQLRPNVTRCFDVLARLTLMGQPCPISDTSLVPHLTASCESPNRSVEQKVVDCLTLCLLGLGGYLPAPSVLNCRTLLLRKRDDLPDSASALRELIAFVDDMFEFDCTVCPLKQKRIRTSLQCHIQTAASSEWMHDPQLINFKPVVAMAQLTLLQNELENLSAEADLQIRNAAIQKLVAFCDDVTIMPHFRAIGELTLANQKYTYPALMITDEEVCLRLRRSDQTALHQDVLCLSIAQLNLFHLSHRLIGPSLLVTFIPVILQCGRGLHGLVSHLLNAYEKQWGPGTPHGTSIFFMNR